MMLTWACVLLASTAAHKVVESTEDIDPVTAASNTTTLYPVKPLNRTELLEGTSKQKTATSWKIETTFGESKLDSNSTGSSEQLVLERPSNSSQEFKPSQHLGDFIDHENFEAGPTRPTPDSFTGRIKRPPAGFLSSSKNVKFPKEVFKNYQQFPYKFEPPIYTKAKDGWQPSVSSLESRPTDEAPVSVPAGGLYKLPQDPFKIRPGTTDEDFGLEFSGEKDRPVKKRVNPMSNLVHLLTALIPVGIIFSALTPNLVTIEPDQPLPPNIFRRADGSLSSVPQISERCRRRLLCELHSETNYPRSTSSQSLKQCYRIHCEDPDALSQSLQWLLSHSPNSGLQRPNGQKPGLNLNHGHRRPTIVRPDHVNDIGLNPNYGYGPRPHVGYLKPRPNEGYGSYRPIDSDAGDHFNADFP